MQGLGAVSNSCRLGLGPIGSCDEEGRLTRGVGSAQASDATINLRIF